MSDVEKLLSKLLTKDPAFPVEVRLEPGVSIDLSHGGENAGEPQPAEAEAEATVTIPQAGYEEMYAAAVKFEILARSYHANTYGVDTAVEKAVFGPSKSAEAKSAEAKNTDA